jgi:hypothetical protein
LEEAERRREIIGFGILHNRPHEYPTSLKANFLRISIPVIE